jgi:hypothetical protein
VKTKGQQGENPREKRTRTRQDGPEQGQQSDQSHRRNKLESGGVLSQDEGEGVSEGDGDDQQVDIVNRLTEEVAETQQEDLEQELEEEEEAQDAENEVDGEGQRGRHLIELEAHYEHRENGQQLADVVDDLDLPFGRSAISDANIHHSAFFTANELATGRRLRGGGRSQGRGATQMVVTVVVVMMLVRFVFGQRRQGL